MNRPDDYDLYVEKGMQAEEARYYEGMQYLESKYERSLDMKEIIRVTCDDEKFNIKIDGDNIDLYAAIAEIIKEISSQRNVTKDTSVLIVKKMVEEE